MAAERDGILFVLSGPSGSGKETVMSHLLAHVPGLKRLTTYTTRAPRPGETEGHSYHFVTDREFDLLVKEGDIFEQERVYGSSRYGSPRQVVTSESDTDFLIELDPNGFRRIRERRPITTVGIFLLVPDLQTLAQRILARHPEEDVQARLDIARGQIRESGDYDYLLMNDDLTRCCQDARLVVEAERLRQRGRAHLRGLAPT